MLRTLEKAGKVGMVGPGREGGADRDRRVNHIIQDKEPTQDRIAPTLRGAKVDKAVSHLHKIQILLLMLDLRLDMEQEAVVVGRVGTQDTTRHGQVVMGVQENA